jgi:hypothetical protein
MGCIAAALLTSLHAQLCLAPPLHLLLHVSSLPLETEHALLAQHLLACWKMI